MKKLILGAALVATLATPVFAQSYRQHGDDYRNGGMSARMQGLRARAAVPADPRMFAPGSDNEQDSIRSPGAINYEPDFNR